MRDVGAAAQRRPYVSLNWCSTPSGHGNGLRPWIRNNGWRTNHEFLKITLDLEYAHVSTPSGHGNGLRPWIRNNGWRTNHEFLKITLDLEYAHVSRRLTR